MGSRGSPVLCQKHLKINQFCSVNTETKIEKVILIVDEKVTYAEVSVRPKLITK